MIFISLVREAPKEPEQEVAEVKVEEKIEEEIKAPLVALVLDDFGYSKKNLESLKEIGAPVTLAVLPNIPYSEEVCRFAEENDMEVILHLPMEPKDSTLALEKDTILVGNDDDAIKGSLKSSLTSVSSAKGVSNHMGSKATSDARVISVIFGYLKERDLYFLDSVTTNASVCEEVAREKDLAYVKRDIFIDHEKNIEYIKAQLAKVEKVAIRDGSCVAIGHDRGQTIEVLREVVPAMKEKGVKFVKLSEIIDKR